MKKHLNPRMSGASQGFTLLELMLVIVILVMVFFPLLQMFQTAFVASQELKGTDTAIFLGTKKIEDLRSLSFSAISSESITTVAAYPAYSRLITVTSTART